MQQAEILSIVNRLIPAYQSADFEQVLCQVASEYSPSTRLLVKMELKRLMAPCTKKIDLRGRVQGECRQFSLDGIDHWLDDVAFNAYNKNVARFGRYTEGVWEALINTHNSYRVMNQKQPSSVQANAPKYQYRVEPLQLGYDLKRKENRLKVGSQIEITLSRGQLIHATTVDLSASGAKLKVPAAFNYKLGEVVEIVFTELNHNSKLKDINQALSYRVVGIDDCSEHEAIRYLRVLKLSESDIPNQLIRETLARSEQRLRHDNQDKLLRARTRGFEHNFLKHTGNLPVFFSQHQLKLVLQTENNQPIWQYWQNERNQEVLSSLFHPQRMERMAPQGLSTSNNILYAFQHEHQGKLLHYSMMVPEATREERHLFWRVGARKPSWKVFRLHIFELKQAERDELARHAQELGLVQSNTAIEELTHCGILQELGDEQTASDYLLTQKSTLSGKALRKFCHPRVPGHQIRSLYFDACSRRKEPRYTLKSPVVVTTPDGEQVRGFTTDISKRGLGVLLERRANLVAQQECVVSFTQLQQYKTDLGLDKVLYQTVRVCRGGRQLQLKLQPDDSNRRIAAVFERIIKHNLDKLEQRGEALPSNHVLEGLHNILLDKIVTIPIFYDKPKNTLRPRTIGVNYPLPSFLTPFTRLEQGEQLVLDPIFKGRTNTLMASPMKRIDGYGPQYFEVYVHAILLNDRTQHIQTRLLSEFDSLQERLTFIKKAKLHGDFYAFRLSAAPVFNPITNLLRDDIEELLSISLAQARTIEREMLAIVGYSEMVDITDEVLVRLEITD
ncbi:PilZ domain-containing protein [Vibrio sp. WXL103]|uniref:PilZ domain-containing protein n=1 Tax=Vibrio sp. WXL103 TaxID=3450710 RepID=UPI003EC5F577